MAYNGFDIVNTQPLTFYQNGKALGSLMVIYRRRQEATMTVYTKRLAPEVRWMKCSACGHTVYEAPSCSYCGAPR